MAKLITTAFACDEYAESPDFVCINVDKALAERIIEMRDATIRHDFADIRDYVDIEQWGTPAFCDEWRLENDSVVVSEHGFYFKADGKHSNIRYETGYLDFDLLAKFDSSAIIFDGTDEEQQKLRNAIEESCPELLNIEA